MKRSVSKLLLIAHILLAYNLRNEEVFKVKNNDRLNDIKM